MVPWILMLIGIGISAWNISDPSTSFVDSQDFQDRVNLALRHTGDQMLKLSGDQSSSIPPVSQESEHYYVMVLKTNLDYDTLPYILERSLSFHDIRLEYSVIIRDCNSESVRLGYNSTTFKRNEVPCIGRDHEIKCSMIGLHFTQPTPLSAKFEFLGLVILFLGMGLLIVRQLNQLRYKINSGPNSQKQHPFQFGNTLLDHHNQIIEVGKTKVNLTYRESKLLHFLVQNINRVVERDRIIDEVWGNEGVIVGRSLDVFVSRLRKILKDDHSIQIKNVHGVGYRLEVA